MTSSKLVTYLRVSTAKQGRSGLGMEAQQAAIDAYCKSVGGEVLASFTEIESGKVNARPELAKALQRAKTTGATLVIAKLDRLSRNAAFLLTLRDSGVRFVAADMPEANELLVGVMALIAQHEREAISRRTREALQAAKARGVVLGNPNGAQAFRRAGEGNSAAVAGIQVKADSHALALRPVIKAFQEDGITSLGALAKALNDGAYKTPRGGIWHKTSVANLLERMPQY